jgi:hypothetical protein
MNRKSNANSKAERDDLDMPPVTREQMRKGVMGKYYAKVMAGSNMVRVAPDVADEFPNESSVNQGLRELIQLRTLLRGIVERGGQAKKRKTA